MRARVCAIGVTPDVLRRLGIASDVALFGSGLFRDDSNIAERVVLRFDGRWVASGTTTCAEVEATDLTEDDFNRLGIEAENL